MGFEKVQKTGQGGSTNEPLISLRKSGGIGINSAATKEYLPDAEFVHLYYDDENSKIGIKPVDEEDNNTYKVNMTESSAGITPSSFMKRHDLVPDVTTRYEVEWDDDEDMLVADLTAEAGTYGSADDEDDDPDANEE
ncbi:hypothetical protein [Candidatus Halobonum tyrrellensis]|uniref:Uncharacterized protein n=1 Tax=Candidatus Halobonum tyrrellensis G22 TaxID=1324957 RepID=V4IUI6_9EURY|nr:hypothetical protein [Candidatus Halobonum tyrrellensis]ESP86842.1 hypothetical protein K933_17202 [Candidatus Halobonum tyrrellensis G22]